MNRRARHAPVEGEIAVPADDLHVIDRHAVLRLPLEPRRLRPPRLARHAVHDLGGKAHLLAAIVLVRELLPLLRRRKVQERALRLRQRGHGLAFLRRNELDVRERGRGQDTADENRTDDRNPFSIHSFDCHFLSFQIIVSVPAIPPCKAHRYLNTEALRH